jgi:hypothetical protein
MNGFLEDPLKEGNDMKARIHRFSGIAILAISMLLVTAAQASGAGSTKQVALPDFTKGDRIPEGANHDWNLGATGLRGWIYTNQMSTADARQIYVTNVDKDSPADGILAVGDVILGVGGKAFSYDPRTEFGKALTVAFKRIYLTGKGENHVPQVSMAAAKSIVDDGRGWTRRDRNSFYDSLTTDQLIARLGNWSPVVRQRSAEALARRNDDVMDRLIGMLDAKDACTRYGACRAIRMQKDRGAPAVPALLKTFHRDDPWLRILSAEALAGIGEPARSATPEMLERLTKNDPKNDPRNMEQRYLSFALFDKGSGLLSQSLKGVDRDLLGKAVRAGLKNEDGKARGSFATVYDNLTFDEIKPLLPAILEAVVDRSPSGVMFSDNIRTKGLELLAKHHIAEAMPLCIDIMDIDRWNKFWRIYGCLKALEYYQGAAKPLLPRLVELEKELVNHREAKMLQSRIDLLRKIIADIKADENPPKLRRITGL